MSGPDALADAFDNFEAAGREARAMVEATERFTAHPEHRAPAYVTLAEARAMAYGLAIAPRTDVPRFHTQTSWHATVASLGPNCPDMRYAVLLLDGGRTYRLRGWLGEMRLGLWQGYSHVLGHPAATAIGGYDLTQLAGPDGTLDIVISGREHPEPYIRLDKGSPLNFVVLRRALGRITDDHGDLQLIDDATPAQPPELDPVLVAEQIDAAAELLRFLVREWAVGLYELYLGTTGGHNRFGYVADQRVRFQLTGSATAHHGCCVFELAPDETLLIEWEPPEGGYWSWQLSDVWSNALDFVNYQTDVNMDTAVTDADGMVRLVVSSVDPGVPNWLDTRGRREAVAMVRAYQAAQPGLPTARVVPLTGLRAALPPDTPTVTPDERADELHARRVAHHDAYGD